MAELLLNRLIRVGLFQYQIDLSSIRPIHCFLFLGLVGAEINLRLKHSRPHFLNLWKFGRKKLRFTLKCDGHNINVREYQQVDNQSRVYVYQFTALPAGYVYTATNWHNLRICSCLYDLSVCFARFYRLFSNSIVLHLLARDSTLVLMANIPLRRRRQLVMRRTQSWSRAMTVTTRLSLRVQTMKVLQWQSTCWSFGWRKDGGRNTWALDL